VDDDSGSDCLGAVNIRTHTSARVVNRASRFHRSAGLDDIGFHSSSGRESPCNASASPSSSPGSVSHVYVCQLYSLLL